MLSVMFIAAAAAVLPPAPERPHDPWIFRSVLDQRPRMVTLALHDSLWVGYDATTCTLYRAWDGRAGGVTFDGAVYTTVHGPQPTTRGAAYMAGPIGPGWRIVSEDGWEDVAPVFRGYRVERGRAVLMFDLPVGERFIRIEESPEAMPADNATILHRQFRIIGDVPEGLTVYFASDRVFSRRPGCAVAVDGLSPPTPEIDQAWEQESAGDYQWVGLRPGGVSQVSCYFAH